MTAGALRLVTETPESDARERAMFGATHREFRAELPNVDLDDPRDALGLAMGILSDLQEGGVSNHERRVLNRVKRLIDEARAKLPRG